MSDVRVDPCTFSSSVQSETRNELRPGKSPLAASAESGVVAVDSSVSERVDVSTLTCDKAAAVPGVGAGRSIVSNADESKARSPGPDLTLIHRAIEADARSDTRVVRAQQEPHSGVSVVSHMTWKFASATCSVLDANGGGSEHDGAGGACVGASEDEVSYSLHATADGFIPVARQKHWCRKIFPKTPVVSARTSTGAQVLLGDSIDPVVNVMSENNDVVENDDCVHRDECFAHRADFSVRRNDAESQRTLLYRGSVLSEDLESGRWSLYGCTPVSHYSENYGEIVRTEAALKVCGKRCTKSDTTDDGGGGGGEKRWCLITVVVFLVMGTAILVTVLLHLGVCAPPQEPPARGTRVRYGQFSPFTKPQPHHTQTAQSFPSMHTIAVQCGSEWSCDK